MPIPLNHSRNVVFGTLPGGEIFNWSLWADRAPASAAAANDQAQGIANAFKNTAGPVNAVRPEKLLGSDANYVGVKTYAYTGGTAASFVGVGTIGVAGNSGASQVLPDQLALVVTLRTALAGRSHTGRIYLPITKWNLSSQGQMAKAETDGLAAWFAAFLTAANTSLTGVSGNHMVVASQKLGTSQSITSVTVDTKIDVQRRRANRQNASGVSSALVT